MTLPFLWDEKIVRQIADMGYGGRPFGDHNLSLIGCAVAEQ